MSTKTLSNELLAFIKLETPFRIVSLVVVFFFFAHGGLFLCSLPAFAQLVIHLVLVFYEIYFFRQYILLNSTRSWQAIAFFPSQIILNNQNCKKILEKEETEIISHYDFLFIIQNSKLANPCFIFRFQLNNESYHLLKREAFLNLNSG